MWPRTAKIRGLAGVLPALLMGCGFHCALGACTTSPPQAAGPSQLESIQETEAAATSESAEGADEEEVLPAYNPEALAARYDAQRALLGDDSLFEDIEGNPVAPSIAPQDQQDAEFASIDDDILLALPGSAGFGLDGTPPEESAANGNALGLYVPIENPKSGPALAHFHEALRKLAAGQDEDGKVRVLVYGASHTQADVYPGYLRAYLQKRFGSGGQGFVSLVRVNKWFRYADWNIDNSKGWRCEHAFRSSSRKDGYYGLLGACGSTDSKRDKTVLAPRHESSTASNYELWYLAQPGGGRLDLYVDGSKQATVDTDADQIGPGYHPFTIAEGSHSVEVRARGDGEIRLFGLVMESESPGVVVDTLGIAGAQASSMLRWDQDIWTDNVQRRDPDLYILAYGVNEAADDNLSIEHYREGLREVLTRLRNAAPEASCLLLGPSDFPREVEEDVWVPRPTVAQVREAQRDIAYEMGCGFWDSIAFMGGVNSMHTWATSKPQMASRDHIHLTRRGYVRMGMAVADAMMASFDRGK